MTLEETFSALRQHRHALQELGVERLFVFGSTARNMAGPHSDVDLFFDHRASGFGLFELMDVKETANMLLGGKADIMTRRSLHPLLADEIQATAVQVF